MKRFTVLIAILLGFLIPNYLLAQEKKDTVDLFDLSLEELVNMEVTTVSNVSEKLNKAPATTIVITAEDIAERGYTELYDVLNDLPGMDLSRAYGDDQYNVSARGYRKTIGDQLLLMIDGIMMNHLYNNNMDAFSQYPLYNIKQIEVVYGPASAVYGANAFAGIINIITKKDEHGTVVLAGGQNKTTFTDVDIVKKTGDLSIGFTGRFYRSDGPDFSDRTPFLSSKLYNNTNLWMPFKNSGYLGYQSPVNQHYLSAYVNLKGLTLGFINWYSETGYGTVYPADKVLNGALWKFNDNVYYARYENTIGKLTSRTLLKYRENGNPNNSMYIERYGGGVDVSYWQTSNRSYSVFQDFSLPIIEKLFCNFGLKYERRELQKAYDETYGPFLAQDSVKNYPFDQVPIIHQGSFDEFKHYTSIDHGAYAQLKYNLMDNIDIIGGIRYDINNIYKEVISPRAGVVYDFKNGLIAKVFYGSAFLEPNSRLLYGGWQGSLNNANLKPEKIKTFEGSVFYSKGFMSNGISAFYNIGEDAIATVNSKPVNVGERKMFGVDYYNKLVFNKPLSFIDKVKSDLYITYIQSEEDLITTDTIPSEETPNIAPIKIHWIASAYMFNHISLSLQTRYIDEITTVKSNPLNKIDAYLVNDIFFNVYNIGVKGLSLGVKIYNVLDIDYYHPGYRDASAGENAFDAAGNHIESKGWYNSRLPQANRTFFAVLKLDF